jgi:hypothetical protein
MDILIFLAYIVYALAQGIILNRFVFKHKDPLGTVVFFFVFAPLVTILTVLHILGEAITFLATPKS